MLPPLAVRMTPVGKHTCDWVVTHKIPPLELDTLRGEEEGGGEGEERREGGGEREERRRVEETWVDSYLQHEDVFVKHDLLAVVELVVDDLVDH